MNERVLIPLKANSMNIDNPRNELYQKQKITQMDRWKSIADKKES
jgi:hypothetical protein